MKNPITKAESDAYYRALAKRKLEEAVRDIAKAKKYAKDLNNRINACKGDKVKLGELRKEIRLHDHCPMVSYIHRRILSTAA